MPFSSKRVKIPFILTDVNKTHTHARTKDTPKTEKPPHRLIFIIAKGHFQRPHCQVTYTNTKFPYEHNTKLGQGRRLVPKLSQFHRSGSIFNDRGYS
uniref:Uncharacterized protein n=1 Tax=Anguilla anguilla TaxID=7936 RepID=A0A0E9UTY2_ANGAN